MAVQWMLSNTKSKINHRLVNYLISEEYEMNIEETRNGILKYLENNGSNATMYILHGYSKLIHQVAHREFSEVMEGLVNDELVIFNDDTFILTAEGSKLVKSL